MRCEPQPCPARRARVLSALASLACVVLVPGCRPSDARTTAAPTIRVWYGTTQAFGVPGIAQRWVNILGNVSPAQDVQGFFFSLNGSAASPLVLGEDLRRLAAPGDFNAEIDRRDLRPGANDVLLVASNRQGLVSTSAVQILWQPGHGWPLPYEVDWSRETNATRAAQIVDGLWRFENGALRTAFPYFDRVLAFGDSSWTNYEAEVELIFHGFTGPTKKGPHYGVTHAGLGFRWEGHRDDGKQPRTRWYPLGAATEFLLFPGLTNCHWRILGDKRLRVYSDHPMAIELGRPYILKGQVVTLPDGRTRYRCKTWEAAKAEPDGWLAENIEGPEDAQAGSFLLVAHNSDVSFRRLKVVPLVGE